MKFEVKYDGRLVNADLQPCVEATWDGEKWHHMGYTFKPIEEIKVGTRYGDYIAAQ